jgi:hypothetical protein
MIGIRKIAIIFILIGISLPIISSLFCSGYSQGADFFVNVQKMYLIIKNKKEPLFKEAMLDNLGIFKSMKYGYKWQSDSKRPELISKNIDKKVDYDLIEVTLEGPIYSSHHGLIIYFPKDMRTDEITDVINWYYYSPEFPAPIPENVKPEHEKLFTKAVRFSGYHAVGPDWIIPFRFLVATGFIMILAGAAIILFNQKKSRSAKQF